MGQVVTVLAGERQGITGLSFATEFVVGVTLVHLDGGGTTLVHVLFTAQAMVRVGQVFPMSGGTTLGVSGTTGRFPGVVGLLVVFAALWPLGLVLAAGDELGVIDAVHRGVDTGLVANIALWHVPVRNDGTALRFILVLFVPDDFNGAGLDLLAVGSVGHVLGEQSVTTSLVVFRLDGLVISLGIDEKFTATVLVLVVVDILLGQNFLTSIFVIRYVLAETLGEELVTTSGPETAVFQTDGRLFSGHGTVFAEQYGTLTDVGLVKVTAFFAGVGQETVTLGQSGGQDTGAELTGVIVGEATETLVKTLLVIRVFMEATLRSLTFGGGCRGPARGFDTGHRPGTISLTDVRPDETRNFLAV